jgi:thiol-disulfide isomerase/thioredoxin
VRRLGLLVVAAVLVLAGCSATKDAVVSGNTFEFVAPGGKTEITYDDPATRGAIRTLSGPSLLQEGKTVGLENYEGRIVVINVWGTWCGPCRIEAPDLEFVHQQGAPLGATVLGIDVRDDRQAATDFVRDRGLTYDSIFDDSGRSLASLGGVPRNVVPVTVVLDKQHRVAYVTLQPIRVPELIPLLQKLAAEPAA